MFPSIFHHRFEAPFIIRVDLDAGRSVTNSAYEIVAGFVAKGLRVEDYHIIYRDSTGLWDALLTRDGRFDFDGYFALGASTEAASRELAALRLPAKPPR